jgi:hypothetical protein
MSDESIDDRDIRLGSLALRAKLVNPDQLRRTLALQAEEALEGRMVPIGVLMVRKGFLTREQLQELLSQQEALRRQAGPPG